MHGDVADHTVHDGSLRRQCVSCLQLPAGEEQADVGAGAQLPTLPDLFRQQWHGHGGSGEPSCEMSCCKASQGVDVTKQPVPITMAMHAACAMLRKKGPNVGCQAAWEWLLRFVARPRGSGFHHPAWRCKLLLTCSSSSAQELAFSIASPCSPAA